ncbi:MAG: hypothetical protein JWN48_5729 [Myxococcaceae bacterium]|nr:hypothetical protein [Myxococcaceae bacterium]
MPRKLRWPDRPSFLEDCFHWGRRGYSFKFPPPIDLMDERALVDADKWIVLASVLEHAKNGDFGHMHRLYSDAIDERGSPTLGGACLDLIADAGGHSDLEFLANLIVSQDVPAAMRVEACVSAGACGELWLVEYMLECWKSIDRHADRESIDVAIRGIIEPEGGEGPIAQIDMLDAPKEYEAAVTARYKQLVSDAGSYETSFFFGTPVDVPTLVWRMRDLVEQDDPGGIDTQWRKFEPMTGVDCSSFHTPTGVDLKAVTAVLDAFEAQRPSASHRFEPGKRYFFGHLVPR